MNRLKIEVAEVERKLQSEVARSTGLVNACKEAARQHKGFSHHVAKAKAQSGEQLSRVRLKAQQAVEMEEWTAQQLKDSHARVKEQERKRTLRVAQATSSGPAEHVGKAFSGVHEERVKEGITRLMGALGCRTVEDLCVKLERASADENEPPVAAVQAAAKRTGARGAMTAAGASAGAPAAAPGSASAAAPAAALGGSVRPPLVFRMMLEAKVDAERRLMAKVNEMVREEKVLARLTHEPAGSLGDIVDYKQRMNSVQESLVKSTSKLGACRTKVALCDERVQSVRIGTERLTQMLACVKTMAHSGPQPPSLLITRRGATLENVGSASFFLTQPSLDDGDEDGGGGGGGDDEPKDGNKVERDGELQVSITLTQPPNTPTPHKDTAAGALLPAVERLRELAMAEHAMGSSHASSSRLVEALGDALRQLAGIEHRAAILMPELRLHDARMRIKMSAMKATDQSRLQNSANKHASNMVLRNMRRSQSAQPRLGFLEMASAAPGASAEGPPPASPDGTKAAGTDSPSSPAARSPAKSPRKASIAGGPAPSPSPASAADAADAAASPPPTAPRASTPSASPEAGGAQPPSAARPQSAALPRRPRAGMSPSERPKSAAAQAAAAANAIPASSVGTGSGLTDVLAVMQSRNSETQSLNVRVGPGGDDDDASAGVGGGGSSSEATAKERDFLWRVFQAFDQDNSGAISVLEVRALFDRVALEESYEARGQRGSDQGKMFKAAAKFITQLFDDDLDGKLSRSEIDRFFAVFNNDNNKLISWDEFYSHASILMSDIRQKEIDRDEAKQHVPSREELKAATEDEIRAREREMRKRERRKDMPAREPKKGGVPSMLTRQASAPPGGAAAAGKSAGERSRAARPGMA